MKTKTYRGGLPKPDVRGDWRPEVGGRRFKVGNRFKDSEGEALRRLNAIRDLFDLQCERYETDRWESWLLGFAKRLSQGDRSVDWEVSQLAKEDIEVDAEIEAMMVDELSLLGFEVRADDPETLAKGRRRVKEWLDTRVKQAVAQAINDAKMETEERYGPVAGQVSRRIEEPNGHETKTFYEAIAAYSLHLEKTGEKNEAGKLKNGVYKRLDRLRYLRDHHEDLPLWQLNLTKLEEHAAYWCNRPPTKKAKRCGRDFAKDMNKELRRLLVWLDRSPDFDWHAPARFHDIKRSPIQLPDDEVDAPFQTITKDTYTPHELAMLVTQADRFGKVLIAVCVNCAFGQSEIGQWTTSKFSLHTEHPHADKVGISSSSDDSWITGKRPKTGCYGEHWLWPEVADALAPFLDGRRVLPVTSTGAPWYRVHSKNAQSEFAGWMSDLLDRVQEVDPSFRRLPFGSFRDVLPDVIRNRYSDEVSKICLHHKTPSDDNLLKCYANVPYRKVFEATKELHGYFQPMLDALKAT